MSRSRQVKALPVERVALGLHSAAIHLLRHVRRQDAAMQIGSAQASALSVLVFGGPRTLGNLADIEMVRPPTMTRIIDGLEKAGLVERKRSAQDRRKVELLATPRGSRLLEAGRARRIALLSQALQRLSGAEFRLLERAAPILQRLFSSPEEATQPRPPTGGAGS
ncbi:MAG TPA: MarR family transcriptional regulator [Steroidobacteraceae bacterium]|nr:MarR family transcriptional regulator [Steroidobacteraceae bacterium]